MFDDQFEKGCLVMSTPRRYDLCVIGSGPAGQKAAIQAAKLGRRACVVEKREVVGGAAINTGTIPSKALREAILVMAGREHQAVPSESDFRAAREGAFSGLWSSCQKVIRAEIELVDDQLRRNRIDVIHGRGRIVDAQTVHAEGAHGTTEICADHIFIATGTRPAIPDGVEFDGKNLLTSDDLPKLGVIPHSMIIVGGGVIGTEYASMLTALGVKVTLIEGRSRVLDFVDAEIIEAFQYHLRRAGATLRLGEKVVSMRTTEAPTTARTVDGVVAEAILESGKTIRADCLMYCVGRQGNTESLGLDAVGLQADSRGRLKVSEVQQTDVPSIYAGGDVVGFPALASTSMEQGRIAACHMFGEPTKSVPELLPYGVYSVPEISMVGWTEERLTTEGVPYEAGIAQYEEIARGQLLGDSIGMLKLLIHQESHVVLGVHAIGTGATELIHIGQAAIAFKATVEYFIDTVFNYPTLAECYKVAAYNALNKLRGS
jgi:NAD(P) transhydrogenase